MRQLFFLVLTGLFAIKSSAQQLAYVDAAQAYNKLLIEKNNGTYIRIGQYKVIGTPYMFGEKVKGNMFAKGETAYNILLSYNTYDQNLAFLSSANPQQPLTKEADEIDSFELHKNADLNLSESMKFINGKHIAASGNAFFRILYQGSKYILLKKYSSVLSIVSTNYIDAALRQFELNAEYYYYDIAAQKIKKIKTAYGNIVKEFGKNKAIESLIDKDALVMNTDNTLITIFAAINQ